MKPTPQTSSNEITRGRLPLTDYNFQSKLESAQAVLPQSEVRAARAFWEMSAEIFRWKFVREHIAFAAIAAPSAWAIIVALHAITRMVRGS